MAPFFARRGLPTSYTCPPKMSEIGLLGAEICVPYGARRGAPGGQHDRTKSGLVKTNTQPKGLGAI